MRRRRVRDRFGYGRIIIIGVLLSFFGGLLLNSGSVWARKCVCGNSNYDPVTEEENDSIYDACRNLRISPGVAQGVMWVSSSNNVNSISSQVNISNWTSGTVNVYLHGAVIGWNSAVSGGAVEIKLVKGTSQIKRSCSGCVNYAPFNNGNGQTTVPTSMSRPGNKRCDTGNDFESNVKTMTLNVAKLIHDETPIMGDDNRHVYEIPLQAFRCFYGVTPPDDRCYSSRSTLNVTVNLIKLIGVARDVDGNRLPNQPISPDPVSPGGTNSLKVTAPDNTNYKFLGWSSQSTGSNLNYGSNKTYQVNNLTQSRRVYAVYEHVEPVVSVTLTSYAYDADKNEEILGSCDSKTITIEKGGSGSATVAGCKSRIERQSVPTDYEFVCWKNTPSGNCLSASNTEGRITKTISADTNVYAVYRRSIYKGRSVINGSVNIGTGYTRYDDSVTGYIENCSPTVGCRVTFKHFLSRMIGDTATTYRIERVSNLVEDKSAFAIPNGTVVTSRSWKGTTIKVGEEVSGGGHELTLYPGMVVCETLYFKGDAIHGSGDSSSTKVCASALGNAQPETGDNTLLDINVKNETLSNEFKKQVYAKPQDNIVFSADYNPLLQYTFYLRPEYMKINSKGDPIRGNGHWLGHLYNESIVQLEPWNNAFSIQRKGRQESISEYKYSAGAVGERTGTNRFTVVDTHVGMEITGRAVTNLSGTNTNTTPSQVTFEEHCLEDGTCYNMAVVKTGSKEATAKVVVPYNFQNSVEIKGQDGDQNSGILYAGEDSSIGYTIAINPRVNKLTTDGTQGAAYATKVVGAKTEVEICYGDNVCTVTSKDVEGYNSSEVGVLVPKSNERNTTTSIERKVSFGVPDLPAGTKVTVRVRMKPSNSGAESNIDVGSFGGWTEWKETTYTIAKRPSIQVVGGNVYTGGNIKTNLSKKLRLQNYPDTNKNKPYVFGSWGELGVITLGKVDGFASGASLGYLGNQNGVIWPNYHENEIEATQGNHPGGSFESGFDFCKLSMLTIANNCKNGGENGAGTQTSAGGIESDQDAIKSLIDRMKKDGNVQELEGDMVISNEAGYYHKSGDMNVTMAEGGGLSKGKTVVIHAEGGKIVIKNNIVYLNDDYVSLEEVPKVIVFAEDGNIEIDCGVERIDGVLMADNVKTCNSDDVNAKGNSTQLVVNGAIIANTLTANRTYGAATGVNSMVSAEIINYDPTLYLWGGSKMNSSGGVDKGEIDVTYTQELAPRY